MLQVLYFPQVHSAFPGALSLEGSRWAHECSPWGESCTKTFVKYLQMPF